MIAMYLFAYLLLAALANGLDQGGSNAQPVASIGCSTLYGAWMATNDNQTVAVWRSLPFAKPPVDSLRWRAPIPINCTSPTYNASEFRGFCVQPDGSGTEDCLYLHVYAPLAVYNRTLANVPVMAYIHGGSLMDGSGNFEALENLAAHMGSGVIIVTINYRLNMFGFLASEELSHEQGGTSGNYGVLDMQAALMWIQHNIGSSGGDPTRVTLAGQSSGGTAIFALLSSPKSNGLFAGAIALSGSPNISISMRAAETQNAPVVETLCSGNVQQRLACLRGQSVAALVSAIPPSWNTPGMWGLEKLSPAGMNFSGLAIVDGKIITHSFMDAMVIGLVDVPLINGNMGQECDLAPEQNVFEFSLAQWKDLLYEDLSAWNNATLPQGVYDNYLQDAEWAVQRAYDSFNTDYGLSCANAEIAIAAKKGSYKSPVYLFVNEWPPAVPISVGPGYNITWAFHTWDYMAAGENWWPNQPAASDTQLSKTLQALWFDFMVDGRLDSATGWKSVEQVADFPQQYGTYVLGTTTRPPYKASQFVVNYKSNICAFLASYGFDARYWWVN